MSSAIYGGARQANDQMPFCSRFVAGEEANATGSLAQQMRNVITSYGAGDEPHDGILGRLKLLDEAVDEVDHGWVKLQSEFYAVSL